jgi:hypothetical protein
MVKGKFYQETIHILVTFNHGRKTKGSIRKIDLAPVLVKESAGWERASITNERVECLPRGKADL